MKKPLFYLAAAGWTLSLIINIFSIAGVDLGEIFPLIWLFHIGVFAVWIPLIFNLRNNELLMSYQRSDFLQKMNPNWLFKIVFKNTPPWMTAISVGGFFYVFVNSILGETFQNGTPQIKDGQFILQNHGDLIRILTEHEYHLYKANEIRGFSGFWIAFYGIAMGARYPFAKKPET
jgi:hypothetical protein